MSTARLSAMKEMSADERALFSARYERRSKSSTVGVVLALFVGSFGAHHFYLGRVGLGVVYAIFFWTWIPGIIGLIEAFFMMGRVEEYNASLAREVAAEIRVLRAH